MPRTVQDPALLVGLETGDDAAVYQLRGDLALVLTTDFFAPVVDDPYTFGAIAAANALSDVYAMGGTPLVALNLVAFPIKELPSSVLGDILRGGLDKAAEASVRIVGGHSIDDQEPKYGLAVTGVIDPRRVVRNRDGRPGDRLVMTKAIGTGIISTALKHQVASSMAEKAALETMLQLNAGASAAMLEVGVDAATDVTGFGLLGHLHYMALASGVAARVEAGAVPLLVDVEDLAAAGEVPSGTRRNQQFLKSRVDFAASVAESRRVVLSDAQTSGGLLLAVEALHCDALLEALVRREAPGVVIGELVQGEPGRIEVA